MHTTCRVSRTPQYHLFYLNPSGKINSADLDIYQDTLCEYFYILEVSDYGQYVTDTN